MYISRYQTSSPTFVVVTTNPPSVALTPNPPLVRFPIPSTSYFIGTHPSSNSNRVTSVATSTYPPSALPQISAHPNTFTQVNQPNHVFLSSPLFPRIKHSHIMHTLPHTNPIPPLQPYTNLALMFFRSTTGHETTNVVPHAAGTKFNVAKSHEQHVAHDAWSEDLPSNTTLPDKPCSPISPNCMYRFLFMNIAHLYAKYRQKNKLLTD